MFTSTFVRLYVLGGGGNPQLVSLHDQQFGFFSIVLGIQRPCIISDVILETSSTKEKRITWKSCGVDLKK